MSDDYAANQALRDRQYEAAWESPETKAWIASLPPAERQRLEAEGLLKPMLANHGNGMSDCDLADSPLASEEPDIIAQIEPEPEPDDVGPLNSESLWDALRRMLGELLNQKNAKLTLECFAVVSGASFLGDSMTDIARRHGVTRAAVSKRCIDIARELNLPPSRSMRAATARHSYRKAQLKLSAKTNL